MTNITDIYFKKELFFHFFWVSVCFVESLCQLFYIVTVKKVKEFICIFLSLGVSFMSLFTKQRTKFNLFDFDFPKKLEMTSRHMENS